MNLHMSGTLLESLAWHCPDLLSELKELAKLDLVELVGSSYGQNAMRFFSYEHNFRQLREELFLYESLLGRDPETIATFWVPERLWETEALAAVLTDERLQNRGYENVLVDDRLLYSCTGNPSPRHIYDYEQTWDPANFQICRVRHGRGLCALPISNNLRQNIPPRSPKSMERVSTQLHWLLDMNPSYENRLIAIYADDMEKVAGVGWDPDGPSQFEKLLRWISENRWVKTVKLSQWVSAQRPTVERLIETGTYVELANEFEAGEGYEKWYYDPRWAQYGRLYDWSEKRVQELVSRGSDPSLIELAWKILLASTWQTAWHTPRTGAHGELNSDGAPSAWVRAIASHSRIAAVVAEAAYWMKHGDGYAHAHLQDLDNDGHAELVVRNDHLFAVFSLLNGGRLVYLFGITNAPGRLFIGNPIDDWNLLEALHEYMDEPPNHPGAFSDVGFEHDSFSAEIQLAEGMKIKVRLRNIEEDSDARGLDKTVGLQSGDPELRMDYSLPPSMSKISTEIGLSPDYSQLLHNGETNTRKISPREEVRGWANGNVVCWVKLAGGPVSWDSPRQARFGHGYLLRVSSSGNFGVSIGMGLPS